MKAQNPWDGTASLERFIHKETLAHLQSLQKWEEDLEFIL